MTSEGPGAAESASTRPRSLGDRILHFGPTRIVLATLAIMAAAVLVQLFAGFVLVPIGLASAGQDSLVYVILLVVAVHFAYIGYVRLVERRRADELSGTGAVRETGAGIAVGIHFAWNFTQGGIFGGRVSGFTMDGLLESELSGPTLLSGGEFGVEASIFALTLGVATGVWFLVRAGHKGHFIAPFWRRG